MMNFKLSWRRRVCITQDMAKSSLENAGPMETNASLENGTIGGVNIQQQLTASQILECAGATCDLHKACTARSLGLSILTHDLTS